MKKLMMFVAVAVVGMFLAVSAQAAGMDDAAAKKPAVTDVKAAKPAVKPAVKVKKAPKKEVKKEVVAPAAAVK